MDNKINFIILCGGSGSRLWPKSRLKMPKQLLRLTNEFSMLQNTILRANHYDKDNTNIIIICNKEHNFIILEQINELNLPNLKYKIIIEPDGRNSGPAICISSLYSNENDISIVMPCDHILDSKEFCNCIEKSRTLVDKSIITFGISPTGPEVGFGYIKTKFNEKMDTYLIEKFIEKPCIEDAKLFFESGNYYWNAGIFIFKNKNMINLFEKYAPDILESCKKCLESSQSLDKESINLSKDFLNIRSISIDYVIMEPLSKDNTGTIFGYTIPYNSFWTDIGSFSSLYDEIIKNEEHKSDKNVLKNCEPYLQNVTNSYIESEKAFVALIGVDSLVVVNTEDSLLICNKNNTQDVKKVVDFLKMSDKKDLIIEHKKVYRPWGYYINVLGGDNDGSKIKRIVVYPGKKLSLQSHNQRSEHWVITKGLAKVQVGQILHLMTVDSHIYIPKTALHRIENIGDELLEFTETQIGTYLGEDDIIRYEDDFGRV